MNKCIVALIASLVTLLVVAAIGVGIVVINKSATGPTMEANKEPAVNKVEEPAAVPEKTAKEAITDAFAAKFGKPAGGINVIVSKQTEDRASGGVTFASEVGGAWFLAAKVNGQWIIVDDGNGTISCAKVIPYNFPKDMVPECWDESTGKLIKF